MVYDVAPSHEFFDIFAVNFNGTSGNPSRAIGPDNHTDTLDIIFKKGGVSAAGVRPGCFVLTGEVCLRTVTISVYGAGDTLLASTLVDVSSLFDDLLGVESEVPIERIRISPTDLNFGAGVVAIDELVFPQGSLSPVPTLSEWGMITAAAGLMLVGVFFAVRKRLRASKQSVAIG